MAALDIVMIALMIYFIVKGFMRGFVMEVASLFGIVISLYVAKWYGDALMSFILSATGWAAEVNHVVSFVVVFLLMLIAVRFGAMLVSRLVKLVLLGWLDKLLGAVFSWLKCVLVMSVLLFSFGKVNGYIGLVSNEYLSSTILYEPVRSLAYLFFPNDTINNGE